VKSETHRRFARLTEWLKGVEGLSVAERAAADRLLAELGRKRTVEAVPQCAGELDQYDRPSCDGADVRRITIHPTATSVVRCDVGTEWCAECREKARDAGVPFTVGQVLPPKPTSYPCRNAFCSVGGKPRRVTREREYCSESCMMEDLNESREANR
jgi:hypothetical protein